MENKINIGLIVLLLLTQLSGCTTTDVESILPAKAFPGGRLVVFKSGPIDGQINQIIRYDYQGSTLTKVRQYFVVEKLFKKPKEVLHYVAELDYSSNGQLIEVKFNYESWEPYFGYSVRTSRHVFTYGYNNKVHTMTTYNMDIGGELTREDQIEIKVFTYDSAQELVKTEEYRQGLKKGISELTTMRYNAAGDMVQTNTYYHSGVLSKTTDFEYGESYNFLTGLPFYLTFYSNADHPNYERNVIRKVSKIHPQSIYIEKMLYKFDVKGRVIKMSNVTEDGRQFHSVAEYEYED